MLLQISNHWTSCRKQRFLIRYNWMKWCYNVGMAVWMDLCLLSMSSRMCGAHLIQNGTAGSDLWAADLRKCFLFKAFLICNFINPSIFPFLLLFDHFSVQNGAAPEGTFSSSDLSSFLRNQLLYHLFNLPAVKSSWFQLTEALYPHYLGMVVLGRCWD